jgi:hypothetical protein
MRVCVSRAAPRMRLAHNAKKGSRRCISGAEFTSRVPQKINSLHFFIPGKQANYYFSQKRRRAYLRLPFPTQRGNIQRGDYFLRKPEQQIYLSEGWILRWMYPLNHSHCLRARRVFAAKEL